MDARLLEADRSVAINGNQLSYLHFGAPELTKPIVYLHGFPGSGVEAVLADKLARDKGIAILGIDRPGFGTSTFVPLPSYSCSANWYSAFLDNLGIARAPLLAVSGGVPFALALAAALPERVSALALVSGMGPLTGESDGTPDLTGMTVTNRLMLKLAAFSPQLAKLPVAAIYAWLSKDPKRILWWFDRVLLPEDRILFQRPEVRQMMALNIARALPDSVTRRVASYKGALQELSLFSRGWDFELAGISCPIKIWHGLADRYVPSTTSIYVAKQIPGAELVLLENRGHFMIIDMMDELITWLAHY